MVGSGSGGGSGTGGGGGGGSGGDSRSSSTRTRRSLRDQQAKRSLRNYRQQSTMSLHERSSAALRARNSSESVTASGGTLSQGGGTSCVMFKTIREASGPGGGPPQLHRSSTVGLLPMELAKGGRKSVDRLEGSSIDKSLGSNCITGGGASGVGVSSAGGNDGNGGRYNGANDGDGRYNNKYAGGMKTNYDIRRGGSETIHQTIDELETSSIPSPTHDIYCCSNVSSNINNKNDKCRTSTFPSTTPTIGNIRNCCGVRYYHKDVNCEAYSAHSSPSHNHHSAPHYHHYEHSHHHLISICRRLMRLIKQAWTGVKFGSGEQIYNKY